MSAEAAATGGPLQADFSPLAAVVWILLGWLALAARWQARKRRQEGTRFPDVLRARTRPAEAREDSARAEAAPAARKPGPAARSAMTGASPASAVGAPPAAPKRVPAQPEPPPAVVASALLWEQAAGLERAGHSIEAREVYRALAARDDDYGRAARQRLERLSTVEGAGWAPWGSDPFGRAPSPDPRSGEGGGR